MDTLPRRVEERALQVNTEEAWHARLEAFPHGFDGGGHLLARVGDQRRKEPSRAELPVRGANCADALDRRCFVEQHSASAIDLNVDEARGRASLRPGGRACRRELHRPATTSRTRPLAIMTAVSSRSLAPSNTRVATIAKRVHSVSVTFLRCGGASGSRPRARAICSASG